jgi:hypothetical protein
VVTDWTRLGREDLLEVRLCDLHLTLEGSWLLRLIERVQRELAAHAFAFRPYFWIGDEWCSPDGIPGVAVPFYLLHPRLMRLERDMMFEVEGASRVESLMLLRHEVGHAMQHAFSLQRRREWQRTFGRATPYPDFYRPDPMSKRFVHHLPGWYAQSHPAEDFAETFAVWLTPRSRWRERYTNWPALKKLRYVDRLMAELRGKRPRTKTRRRPYALRTLRHTLREHYARRREHYDPGFTDEYDRDLLKLFSAATRYRRNETAVSFLKRHRAELREQVAEWTGEYQMTVDLVLRQMIGRCRELGLRLTGSERATRIEVVIVLTVHTVHLLHRRDEWHAV